MVSLPHPLLDRDRLTVCEVSESKLVGLLLLDLTPKPFLWKNKGSS